MIKIKPTDSIFNLLMKSNITHLNMNKNSNNKNNDNNNVYNNNNDNNNNTNEEEEQLKQELQQVSSLTNNIAGVWLANSNSNSNNNNSVFEGLKIHKNGLKIIDDNETSTIIDNNNINNKIDTSTTTITTTITKCKISGSSSIGGWGVDKGTVWKPVDLPKQESITTTGDKSKAEKNKNKKNKNENSEEIFEDLFIKKDELFKTIINKMTPYFAIVTPTGELL